MLRLACVCSTALLLTVLAGGQTTSAHTDFSGRWRMVKELSDFGSFTRPDIVVRVIDQHGPTLNLHTVETVGGKTSVSDLVYAVDGTESVNTRSGREANSTTFWDGSALMIRTNTTDSRRTEVRIVEHWELSPDGQTLTTTSDYKTAGGASAHLTLVCRKEGGR